jgi:hypothetical protein
MLLDDGSRMRLLSTPALVGALVEVSVVADDGFDMWAHGAGCRADPL